MEHLLIPLVPVNAKFSQGQVPFRSTNGSLHRFELPDTWYDNSGAGIFETKGFFFFLFPFWDFGLLRKKVELVPLQWKHRRQKEYSLWSRLGQITIDISYFSSDVNLLDQFWAVCEKEISHDLFNSFFFFFKKILNAYVANSRLATKKIYILITKGKEQYVLLFYRLHRDLHPPPPSGV